MQEVIRVTIDLAQLASELSKNRKYVTISEISRRLGVSEKTAGKILARLEQLGYARRYSSRTYELSVDSVQFSDMYTFTTRRKSTIHIKAINR